MELLQLVFYMAMAVKELTEVSATYIVKDVEELYHFCVEKNLIQQ